jgi:hypothetical protein
VWSAIDVLLDCNSAFAFARTVSLSPLAGLVFGTLGISDDMRDKIANKVLTCMHACACD